jgi:signal transduction histidine kinase
MTSREPPPSYDSRVDPAVQMARVPARPTGLDVGLVVVLLAWAVAEAVSGAEPDDLPAALVFAAAVTAPLLFRRRHPVSVLGVVALAVLLRGFTADGTSPGAMPFPSLLVVTFSLALHVADVARSAVLGAVPAVLMLLLTSTGYFGDEVSPASTAILVFFVGGAWSAGRLVRRAALLAEAEQTRAEERARAAVAEERTRIARELHDVVAHAVSVVVVQAGAAEALVDKDPAAAREHLAAVRRTGREALTEMRHLLHVLREDEATYSPQPTLQRVGELVDDTSRGGTPVRLEVEGDVESLPAGVGLCAYRVVQEALTNVRKHAHGSPTVVSIVREPDLLTVTVDNDALASSQPLMAGTGHGLLGMRERVRLYGGSLLAGHRDGGFAVQATIPLEAS